MNSMKELMHRFVGEVDGQDLVEYSLLLAFICVISAALFSSSGTVMSNIWDIAQNTLSNAQSSAS